MSGSKSQRATEVRAAAERDALLELLAIFAHDLSNPLQSLTVLCELSVDEPGAREDDRLRAEQCLDAAERMRVLVHNLAGLTRGIRQSQTIGSACDRVGSLLARRFERHKMTVESDLAELAKLDAPLPFELAFLTLALGAVVTAADHGIPRSTLRWTARDGDIFVELAGPQTSHPLVERYVDQARAILEGTGVDLVPNGNGLTLTLGSRR